MPLRTTVGQLIELADVSIVSHSPILSRSVLYAERNHEQPPPGFEPPPLNIQDFMPDVLVRGGIPGAGTSTFPISNLDNLETVIGLPFDINNSITTRAGGPIIENQKSQEFWFEIEITLDTKRGTQCPIIGGILFGGYPYLPYYITPQGENSANFGLPREIHVSWENHIETGFLDEKVAFIRQETTSHSGLHIMATGPVKSEKIRIRFADFPRIIRRIQPDGDRTVEFWGVFIPYLGVFSYSEDVRYTPKVPAGLLGAVKMSDSLEQTYFEQGKFPPQMETQMKNTSADFVFTRTNTAGYFPMSAASLFNGGRLYEIPSDNDPLNIDEIFISQKVQQREQIRLYFQQTEEHPRCLSGITITFPNPRRVVQLTNDNSGIFDLLIYEIDPVEGVSPIAMESERDPAHDQYSNLIYYQQNQIFEGDTLQCRFSRPTNARYLVAVFHCTQEGHLALTKLELIQSAHVFISSRQSRSQQMRQLNFRIIGKDLAEDYSRLGKHGFKFTIEHVVGGELKEILFEARSLTDLLQLSGVKLYANQRYLETVRDVSVEQSETLDKSFDHRYHYGGSQGWKRSQTGEGTSWPFSNSPLTTYNPNPGEDSFYMSSNAESRTHTQHIGFVNGENKAIPSFVDTLENALGATIIDRPPQNVLLQGDGWDSWQIWQGLDSNRLTDIDGLLNLSVPPIDSIFIDMVDTATDLLTLNDGVDLNTLTTFAGQETVRAYFLLNGIGFNLGVNAGVSLIASGGISKGISMTPSLPTSTRTSANGNTGKITLTANKTGRYYAQTRDDSFDESESYTEYRGGQLNRSIVRDLFQSGTIRNRREAVNVHWQELPLDIVVGTIPLNLELPALTDKLYTTRDEWIRIRFGNGMVNGLKKLRTRNIGSCEQDLVMDVWFDMLEEVVKNDY